MSMPRLPTYRGYRIDGTSDPQTKMAYAKLQPHMFGICVPSVGLRITSQMSRFMLYTHVCAYAILGHQTIIYTPSTFTCTCTYIIYVCVYAYIYIYIYTVYIYVWNAMSCHVLLNPFSLLVPSVPFFPFLFSEMFLPPLFTVQLLQAHAVMQHGTVAMTTVMPSETWCLHLEIRI